MRAFWIAVAGVALALPAWAEDKAGDLAPPVKILAGGKPINVDIGHAAPFYADIDGRGVKDLLVGQFQGGKLRIYRNVGTSAKPKFEQFTWFLDGREGGTVPAS
jgi:hypothetical protein